MRRPFPAVPLQGRSQLIDPLGRPKREGRAWRESNVALHPAPSEAMAADATSLTRSGAHVSSLTAVKDAIVFPVSNGNSDGGVREGVRLLLQGRRRRVDKSGARGGVVCQIFVMVSGAVKNIKNIIT